MIEKILPTASGELLIKMPTLLSELTLGQAMALQEGHCPDELDAISLLSGISKHTLLLVSEMEGFHVFGLNMQSLNGQLKYLYATNVLPRQVIFLAGLRKINIKVDGHLSIEPAEAFLNARDIIAEEINAHIRLYGEEHWHDHFVPSLRSCCHLLSQYFFCRVHRGKYNWSDALDFSEEVKKLQVTEALPIAKYFFSVYPDLLHQKLRLRQRLFQLFRKFSISRRIQNGSRHD